MVKNKNYTPIEAKNISVFYPINKLYNLRLGQVGIIGIESSLVNRKLRSYYRTISVVQTVLMCLDILCNFTGEI